MGDIEQKIGVKITHTYTNTSQGRLEFLPEAEETFTPLADFTSRGLSLVSR